MDGEKCTLLKNKTMTDIEFEQILHRMSKEDLDKWNRMKGKYSVNAVLYA